MSSLHTKKEDRSMINKTITVEALTNDPIIPVKLLKLRPRKVKVMPQRSILKPPTLSEKFKQALSTKVLKNLEAKRVIFDQS